jgi:DNA polymerase III subunit epsilon
LDTETTGLYLAEIVQIGVINLKGEIILNSLVKPTISIPPEVTAIHGIRDESVRESPSFTDIYPEIVKALESKNVVIYNSDFDISILNYCCQLHHLAELKLWNRSVCAMEYYAQYYGDWSHYHKSYRWQPLGGNHNAIGDCIATLKLIEAMAQDVVIENLKGYFRELSQK